MQVSRHSWATFSPRRLTTPTNSSDLVPPSDPGVIQERKLDQLRAEHPWASRTVEVLQTSSWIAHQQSVNTPLAAGSAALSGVTAVASAAWGINKLAQAETPLDGVEGVGHLALAVDASMSAVQQLRPEAHWAGNIATPAAYLAAGAELTLGGVDLVRGLREQDTPRTWVGVASLVSGAGLAASVAFPGATGIAQALAVMSMVARQSIYGITPENR